jgi:hypothetical protein
MIYFSFSLYGSLPKYTVGMIHNARHIATRFPEARVLIYISPDVPTDIHDTLKVLPNVKLIYVAVKRGSAGMFDRFLAFDEHDCDILFVRDADSRVYERDAQCIEDFINSDKTLHIIRDHFWHTKRIMGGLWGMRKKEGMPSMRSLIASWHVKSIYGNDQDFLAARIYPLYHTSALIHDRYARFSPPEVLTPFRAPLNEHFAGQVYIFDTDGAETTVYDKDTPT